MLSEVAGFSPRNPENVNVRHRGVRGAQTVASWKNVGSPDLSAKRAVARRGFQGADAGGILR